MSTRLWGERELQKFKAEKKKVSFPLLGLGGHGGEREPWCRLPRYIHPSRKFYSGLWYRKERIGRHVRGRHGERRGRRMAICEGTDYAYYCPSGAAGPWKNGGGKKPSLKRTERKILPAPL